LDQSETELGEWTINYLPEEGGRYTGKLKVGASELRFTSLYESSNKTIIKAIFIDVATYAASGGHLIYRYSTDKEAIVALPTKEISSVEATKKGIMNRAEVTMRDGPTFIFNYGMLPVKKLVEAIRSVI
jgi:hypothetical protein